MQTSKVSGRLREPSVFAGKRGGATTHSLPTAQAFWKAIESNRNFARAAGFSFWSGSASRGDGVCFAAQPLQAEREVRCEARGQRAPARGRERGRDIS